MKKIALMIAALGATFAFSACTESADDHPTLGTTNGETVEFLNTPEMANMAIQFNDENKTSYIHMTCSQPEQYGFAAPVNYQVEVSLSEDFTTPKVEGCPAAVVLGTSFSKCDEINPVNDEIARAMCDMLNIQSSDQIPTPYYKLYMRLIANVNTTGGTAYPNTTLVSNTVSINGVSVGYLAIILPGLPSGIYLRGAMDPNWAALPEWEFLTTLEANVYELPDVTIAKGTEFKVADANWGAINYGAGDGTLEFGKPYQLEYNAGNITMPENFTGRVQLTVKGSTYTVLFEAAEPDTPGQDTGVYIRGDLNGWAAAPEAQFLTTDIKHVWRIDNITITAGNFKVADADWAQINLGGDEAIVPGTAYTLVPGGGNIPIADEFTGSATLSLRGGKYVLLLTPAN